MPDAEIQIDDAGFKSAEVSMRKSGMFAMLELFSLFNNDAISYDLNRLDSDKWVFGDAFPAEDLPESNRAVVLNGVTYLFPDKRDEIANNLSPEGQSINFTPTACEGISFLCAADNGDFEESIWISDVQRREFECNYCVNNWSKTVPNHGALPGIITSHVHRAGLDVQNPRTLWTYTSKFDHIRDVQSLRFGFNPSVHIFAITLHTSHLAEVANE